MNSGDLMVSLSLCLVHLAIFRFVNINIKSGTNVINYSNDCIGDAMKKTS